MSKTKIIALTGRSRSGKSTVAGRLIAGMQPWIPCWRYSFATPLKTFLHSLGHGKSDSPLFRKLAQSVGDTCRQIKTDIFSKSLCEAIRDPDGDYSGWSLVDDLRYQSELETLKQEFGPENVVCFRLGRTGSGLTGGLAAHASETQCSSIPAHDVDNSLDDDGLSAASEIFLRSCLAFAYRPRIYVAGPLTVGDREQNVRRALAVAGVLRKLNFPAFVPHSQVPDLHGYQFQDAEYYRGLVESLSFVRHWTELLVYLEGESPGRDRELRECQAQNVFNLPWDRFRAITEYTLGGLDDGTDAAA